MSFEICNASGIIATYNHVIDKNQQKCTTLGCPTNKEGAIILTLVEIG